MKSPGGWPTVLVLAALWLVLLGLHWARALQPRPVAQADVEEAYLGHLCRALAYAPGPGLEGLRPLAEAGLGGAEPVRLARRALYEGARGRSDTARQLWLRVQERAGEGWPRALAAFYLQRQPAQALPEPGFFRDQYRLDLGQLSRAEMESAARRSAARLQFLAVLMVGNLCASLVTVLSMPWWSERWPPPQRLSTPPPLQPVLTAFLLWQLLAILVIPVLFSRTPLAVRMLAAQPCLYVLGVLLLAPCLRLRPSLPRPRQLALGVLGYWLCLPVVLIAVWLTNLFFKPPQSVNPALDAVLGGSGAVLLGMGLIVAVAAPCFEEYLFRGGVFRSLLPSWGLRRAVLASALLFSVVHADPAMTLPLTGLGVVFAWLTWRSGSLVPAMVAHSFWNGATFLLLTLSRGG